jgi:hypothetical protein
MKLALLGVVLSLFTFAQISRADVCDRSKPVYTALQTTLKKTCKEIVAADLAAITDLKLPHIHIKSFKDDDFAGLTNLKKLFFHSLLHNLGTPEAPIAIGEKVFVPLAKLEELVIDEDLGLLPDGVFAGLVSLKVLDLSNSTLSRLPASLLTLPKIEKVYFDGEGMSSEDYNKVRVTLGNKLFPGH